MAKRTIHSKFTKIQRVQYRQEDEIVNGEIDITRWKRDIGIQYRHEKKEDKKGFIPKPVARS